MEDELQIDTEELLNTIPTGNHSLSEYPELIEYRIPGRTNIDEDILREIRENRSLPVAGSSNTDLSVEEIVDEANIQQRQNHPLPDSIRMPQLQFNEYHTSNADTLRLGIFQGIQEALLKEEIEKLKQQREILMLRNIEREIEIDKIKKSKIKSKGKGKGRTLQPDTPSGIRRRLNKGKGRGTRGGYKSKKKQKTKKNKKN